MFTPGNTHHNMRHNKHDPRTDMRPITLSITLPSDVALALDTLAHECGFQTTADFLVRTILETLPQMQDEQ